MKLPKVTTRHLLILAALVALGLGFRGWMHRRGDYFSAETTRYAKACLMEGPQLGGDARRRAYYWEMARKYERAARNPWLPVFPDPPEPK